jgi:hypothetical protein
MIIRETGNQWITNHFSLVLGYGDMISVERSIWGIVQRGA